MLISGKSWMGLAKIRGEAFPLREICQKSSYFHSVRKEQAYIDALIA